MIPFPFVAEICANTQNGNSLVLKLEQGEGLSRLLKRKSDKFNVKTFTKLSRKVGTVNVAKDLNADALQSLIPRSCSQYGHCFEGVILCTLHTRQTHTIVLDKMENILILET